MINALTYTINKNLAPIVSMSCGKCEQFLTASEYNAVTALLAQAAAQGITVLAGSGDSGPAGCDHASPITHAASVDFPAITAFLVQKTGEPQGNINPRLYAIAATSPGAFHDVTQGSTVFNCNLQALGCPFGTLGFQAGTGYDQATGLGSVDAANLVNAWPDFGLSSNPPALTVARGAVGTATISVSPVNGFNDAVTLSCTVSNSLTNTSCSIPSAPSAERTASLTITAGATAGLSIWELPPSGWDNSTGLALLVLTTGALLLCQRRRSTTIGAYACILLAVAAFGFTSCGNGSASGATVTPAARPVSQTGAITITASANTSSKSLTLPVTVQ